MLSRHTIFYTIAKFLPSLAGFITLTVCSYFLVPIEIGKFNIIYTGTLLVNSLLFQWLRVTLARYYYKFDGELQDTFINTIVFFVKVTLLVSLVISILIIILNPREIYFYTLGVIWLSVFSVYDINLELHRTTLSSKKYLKIELTKSMIQIILSVSLIAIFKNYYVLIASYIFSQIVPLIFNKHDKIVKRGSILSRDKIIEILKFGFPLALMLSSSFINNTIDRVLIANYLNLEMAGLYSVGYDMFRQTVWIPFMIMNLANFPILIKLYEENKVKELETKLKENVDFMITMALVIMTLFFINSREIVSIFIGNIYRETAIEIMPYIVISTILYGISIFHFNYSFQFKSKTGKIAIIYLVGSIVKIFLNVIFLQEYGILVAAKTTLLTYMIILLLSILIGHKEYSLPKPNYMNFTIIALCSIIMIKIGGFVNIDNIYLSLIVKTFIIIISYVFLIYRLGIIKVDISLKRLQLKQK
ncbi:oligosaccharide flippase family protein [Spirosoma pulveris]